MRFFCMDLHISVIADFKSLNPDVEVIDWCLSGHSWVMNRPRDCPNHIGAHNWRNLSMDMIVKFQNEYDAFLKTFDGFIVAYAGSFAMIYEKYNKPIIMINAVRYDMPFCFTKDLGMLMKYKECLDRLQSHKLLYAVSNNKADQLYLKQGAGIDSTYIPSICLYTQIKYTPTRPTFLCYDDSLPDHPLVTHKRQLPRPYQWSDIQTFKGIIHFPYEVSTMSMFEHFTGGMPLFFPSKTYWKANPNIQSMSAYWNTTVPSDLLEFKDLNLWIDLSDVYTLFDSPNTRYFDSIPHLFKLLEEFVYTPVDKETYIEGVREQWKSLLALIPT